MHSILQLQVYNIYPQKIDTVSSYQSKLRERERLKFETGMIEGRSSLYKGEVCFQLHWAPYLFAHKFRWMDHASYHHLLEATPEKMVD